MKIKKISIRVNIFRFIRYSYSLTIALIVIFLLVFLGFLYRNVYQTLGYAKEVTGLKQKVTAVILDMEQFDLALEKIEAKTKNDAKNYAEIFNPFLKVASEPAKSKT